METKSYAEMLHDIFVQYHGSAERITPFETSIILLIEKILTKEREKLLLNGGYTKNNDLKTGCDSCSWHNTITDCGLKSNICIDNDKYRRYRKVHLLPCDRCKTYSVVTRLDKILDKNTGNILKPIITFLCLKCNESPIINGTIFRGFELKGVKFSSKYLKAFKEKKQQNAEIKAEIRVEDNVKESQNTEIKAEIDAEKPLKLQEAKVVA